MHIILVWAKFSFGFGFGYGKSFFVDVRHFWRLNAGNQLPGFRILPRYEVQCAYIPIYVYIIHGKKSASWQLIAVVLGLKTMPKDKKRRKMAKNDAKRQNTT